MAAGSPRCKPWEVEPINTQAPDGQRREEFWSRIFGRSSRFGASHGPNEGRWLALRRGGLEL